MPDTIVVTGNSRVDEATIRGTIGLFPHATLNYRDVQRAIKALFSTGNFDDIRVVCSFSRYPEKVALNVQVKERPVLASTSVSGVSQAVTESDVKERLELPVGSPVDPAAIAMGMTRADSLYQSAGYYLAKIRVDSTLMNGDLSLKFHIDEGPKLAISGVKVLGIGMSPPQQSHRPCRRSRKGSGGSAPASSIKPHMTAILTDRVPSALW